MVEGGKVTLRFEIDNEQFKRIIQEINKDLDKFKEKATQASTGADNLGSSVKKAGEQTASAAIQFQTMMQGAINLTTSFAQTYASVSNIQRAHTSLAQSMVSLDRAEDQLQRKQFKLNQEMAKAVPNMEKVALLQNEIATAMDDYAVKQQKVKDTQDQLNDTQLLFAVNLVNVGFSAIQTGVSMKNLALEMKAAGVASSVLNATMGKWLLIAGAVIVVWEGIAQAAKAAGLQWGSQISIVDNLGRMMDKTFTSADQILGDHTKVVKDYGASWKDVTKTLGEETDKQTQLVKDWQNAQRLAIGNMHMEMGRAFQANRNFSVAPEKGAVGNTGFSILPLAYGEVSPGRKSSKAKIDYSHFDATSIFAQDYRMFTSTGRHTRLGDTLTGSRGFFDSTPMGSAGAYHQEFWKDTTLNQFGSFSEVNEYKKAYANYKRALDNFRLFLKDDPEEFNRLNLWEEMGRAEVALVEIEMFLEKVNAPVKSGKPDLSQFTPNTSFIAGTDEEVATGLAEVALNSFKASKDYMERARRTDNPKLKREYMALAQQYQKAGRQYAQTGQNIMARQFHYGTNRGRGSYIQSGADLLTRIGMSGMNFAITQLGFGGMRGDANVLRGMAQSSARVNLGGQIGRALSMFSEFGGNDMTGKQSEQIMKTLSMTLGGMRAALKLTRGSPFNTKGPRNEIGRFSGMSSSMASNIAGLTAGTGAARNRAGGHSKFRRDRFGGRLRALNAFTIAPGLASAGFDGFSLGVEKPYAMTGRIGKNASRSYRKLMSQQRGEYISSLNSAFSRALSMGEEYKSFLPVMPYDPSLSDLDDFTVLGDAISRISGWRNQVQSMLSLSFQNQAQIELDSMRGRDELEDRIRFEQRRAKIASGVSSI